MPSPPSRIEDYAMIGDCETAALVARNGSIDWLCWPRFDSDACFAALLGGSDNGRWIIAPTDPAVQIERRYRGATLILETVFSTAEGEAALVDFMPLRDSGAAPPLLIRIIEGRRGRLRFNTELILRFGYGQHVPWVTSLDPQTLTAIDGPDRVTLRTSVALRGKDLRTVGDFAVDAGTTLPFVLSYSPSHLLPPPPIDAQAALAETEAFWEKWTGCYHRQDARPDAVARSLITLKALSYRPTGGIVAAATTSLPEQIGGPRNWDYRFCWLRDATLTLLALMEAGYHDEAHAWRDWLVRAAAGSPAQIQIMYGIAGERRLLEWEADWLPGYEGSRPVRIGNAAHDQVQLDVFGEVVDTLHQANCCGLKANKVGWNMQRAFLRHLEEVWQQPGSGMWEMRGPPRQFTFSKVMCWVAFDRAVKSAEQFGLAGPIDQWRATRDEIHAEVCAKGYDAAMGSFVQSYGSTGLDASLLKLSTVGFLPASDPRVRGTVEAIERHLMPDGLVLRYDAHTADDGLAGGEGAFLACSFWLVDAYVALGRIDDARRLFERLLGLRNDLGLFSEEYEPTSKRQVGNFPQAFSHVALVNSARNLARYGKSGA